MPDNPNNNLCKAHSGIKARMEAVEDDVNKLWKRLDKILMMGLLILGGLAANLIVLLLK